MKKKVLLLGALFVMCTAMFAQNGNVGINTTTPGTTLDVNGAITNRETAVAVAGNAATIPANISQARLTGSATANVSITAPAAPNPGQRLIVYNNTTGGFGAALNGFTIANGQAMEFTYSNGGWRATNGGTSAGSNDWAILGNTGTNPANNFLGTIDNQDLVIRTNNAEIMRVTANGRVGIGNSTPIAKLGVHDAIGTSETPIIRIRNTSPLAANNTAYLGFNSYAGGGANWGMGSIQADGTNLYNSKFFIMYSGGALYQKNFTIVPEFPGTAGSRFFVGINTENPAADLHIRDNGGGGSLVGTSNPLNIALRVENANNGQAVTQLFRTQNNAGVLKQAVIGVNPEWQGSGAFVIGRDGLTNDFLVDLNSGHVSMGTNPDPGIRINLGNDTGTTENPILRVSNTSPVAASNKAMIGFNSYNGGGSTWALGSEQIDTNPFNSKFHLFYSLGGNYLRRITILPSGFVGIGNVNPAYNLDVTGDINASGSVRAAGVALTSDARLKKDITTTKYGIQTIMALRPVEYEKKEGIGSKDYNRHEIGFVAQEVADVLPSLVITGTDADKTLAVSYMEIIPVLTKAMQDQQKEIEQLKSENGKLMHQTTELQKNYSQLELQLKNIQQSLGEKTTQKSLK